MHYPESPKVSLLCFIKSQFLFSDFFEFGIQLLYPIIALITITVSFGYLYLGFQNPKIIRKRDKKEATSEKVELTNEERDKARF